MKSQLRILGALAIVGGLAGLGFFFISDTTVDAQGGGRIHNLGLMQERRDGMTVSAVVAGVGCALFVAGELGGRQK